MHKALARDFSLPHGMRSGHLGDCNISLLIIRGSMHYQKLHCKSHCVLWSLGGEDQRDLPYAEHVQLGHSPALPDSRVLVSCGRPGRNTASPHKGNCE